MSRAPELHTIDIAARTHAASEVDQLQISRTQQVLLANDEFSLRRFGRGALKPQLMAFRCDQRIPDIYIGDAVHRLVQANTWCRVAFVSKQAGSEDKRGLETLLQGNLVDAGDVRYDAIVADDSIRIERIQLPASSSKAMIAAIDVIAQRSCEIATTPPIRVSLLCCGDQVHSIVLGVSPLVCDDTSIRTLARTFVDYLTNLHRVSAPDSDRGHLRRFGHESKMWRDMGHAAAMAFWKGQWEQLGEARLTVTDFPLALPPMVKPPNRTIAGCYRRVDADMEALDELCACLNVSPHAVCFTAAALAIKAVTFKPRFPLWTTFSNRDTDGRPVGVFDVPHMIPCDLCVRSSGQQLISDYQTVMTEARRHSRFELAELWRHLRRVWEKGLRVSANYFASSEPASNEPPPKASRMCAFLPIYLPYNCRWLAADCQLSLERTGEGGVTSISYCNNMIPAVTAQRLLTEFHGALRSLVHEPEQVVRWSYAVDGPVRAETAGRDVK